MERHVRILAILSQVWGGLAIIMGTSMLCLAGGAAALLHQPSNVVGALAGIAAGSFLIVGLVAVVWGAASLLCGRLLRDLTPFGRVLGLALGLVNLLVLPFGTALGAYGLWVLLTHEGRALFHSHPTAAA